VGLLVAALAGVAAFFVALVVPPLVEQGKRLTENLPAYVDELQGLLGDYPTVQGWLQDAAQRAAADPAGLADELLSFGTGLVSGVANLLILVTLTVYLLLDGTRLFAWLTAGMSPSRRARAGRLRAELSRVVGGYVLGQAIVSSLFAVFTFVTLSAAGVPEPLLLAALAFVLDAVPLVGATIATVPAVLLAATVSVPTALVVLVLFVAYQQVENNLVAPRAFGSTLQISSLAVFIAVMIGSTLLGVVGALLALPVAAAIPVIARALRGDDSVLRERTAPSPAEAEPEAKRAG
jgi:predicted PurR-regulated permease PerM